MCKTIAISNIKLQSHLIYIDTKHRSLLDTTRVPRLFALVEQFSWAQDHSEPITWGMGGWGKALGQCSLWHLWQLVSSHNRSWRTQLESDTPSRNTNLAGSPAVTHFYVYQNLYQKIMCLTVLYCVASYIESQYVKQRHNTLYYIKSHSINQS